MNRVTRDDTEHGVEYVRADEAQATFDNLNIALTAWHDKTDWVQATAQPMELGMHRADVLKQRIDALKQAVADEREAIMDEWWACVQSDLESGVKSLNERAAEKWKKEYPAIAGFAATIEARSNT